MAPDAVALMMRFVLGQGVRHPAALSLPAMYKGQRSMATQVRTRTVSAPLMWAGIALIAITGLIHLLGVSEYYEKAAYVGVLFVFNVIGAAVSAYGISRHERWGWLLGILVAGGAFLAFIISRTVGLPAFDEHEWEAGGLISLVVEAAYVVVAALALGRR